jgi:predicted aconitase with swiveling domain
MVELKGKIVFKGRVKGEALVTKQQISFYGGVDPDKGIITEKGHELEGKSIAGKILIFPSGKGSTVGSYGLYRMKKNGVAPLGMINQNCETIVAVGAVISEIPMVDGIDISKITSGYKVEISGDTVKF